MTYPPINPRLEQSLAAVRALSPLEPGTESQAVGGGRDLPGSGQALVGICGAPRSGKDMVAVDLKERYALVERTTISDSILAEVNEYLAETGHLITHANKSHPAYRALLQEWGQARSDADPEHWTSRTFAVVDKLQSQGMRLVLVTGIRRPAEVEALRKRGGVLWRVVRPENDYPAEHEVEKLLAGIEADQTLINGSEGRPDLCLQRARAMVEELCR